MARPTKKKAAAKKSSKPAKTKKAAKAKPAKPAKAPKEKTPKVKPVVSAPAPPSVKETAAIPVVAVVEEISTPNSPESTPSVAAEPTESVSNAVQSLAKSLSKIISSHPRTLTRKEVLDVANKTPQFMYANPIFDEAKKTFVIEVSDNTGKMTIPSSGSYPFFG
jgi:hypothetical protein